MHLKGLQAVLSLQTSPQEALTFAYQYGFPLYAYGLYLQAFIDPQVNVPYPYRNLASPEDVAVVRPNVDTLYTPLFYDLSQSDLEFTIPEFDDRYWLWPWYDLYGNNFGNIGSLQGFTAGKYLLRLTNDSLGVQTEALDGEYLAYVNSPTPYGLLLNRILVKESTEEDLIKIHKFQDQMEFKPVPRSGGNRLAVPPFDLKMFSRLMDGSSDEALGNSVLDLVAEFSRYNPTEVIGDRKWIQEMLEKAGIADGRFTQPAGTELIEAMSAANASAARSREPPGLSEDLGNGWTQPAPEISGDFTSYYAARMFIAQRGYLMLTRDQAAYPGFTGGAISGSDRFNVTKEESYLLSFPSGRPHLKETGFWSLTTYGADQYLIPNGMERYSLGDRSNLTYPDGTLIDTADGKEFKILIQAADVEPPEEWINNWLPGPAGGGVFTTSFRFYGAEPSMTNGTWQYPIVTRINAIKE